ncbi:MAG: hypothetical protein HY855_25770 [Burkholderiales bacterium]|nr:hypothetical protein [Burkholderiales bacterium]
MRRRQWAWLAAGLLVATAVQAADGPALLTVVDGPATVIDGARQLGATPGQRLAPASIIDTGPNTPLVRVEFADGSALDLGPDTHVMLLPPGLAGSGPRGPAFYLLQGWAKHTSAKGATVAGQLAPQLELLQVAGVTVGRVAGDESALFIESGKAQLLERKLKGAAPQALKSGDFYTRSGADKGSVAAKPASAFLSGLPRSFRDTLPPLAAQFKGKAVEARPLPAPAYAALKPWLSAEPVIRREFPRRFATLAQDAAFREGLAKNLAAHPEWEPVLYPKPASGASR